MVISNAVLGFQLEDLPERNCNLNLFDISFNVLEYLASFHSFFNAPCSMKKSGVMISSTMLSKTLCFKGERISMQMRRQRLPRCIIDEVQQLIPI